MAHMCNGTAAMLKALQVKENVVDSDVRRLDWCCAWPDFEFEIEA